MSVSLSTQNPIKTITKNEKLCIRYLQPENCLTSYEPHGYCVIYSSADRASFILAERIIQSLWTSENIAQKAVILVGNKADLARSRCVTTEGKNNNNNNRVVSSVASRWGGESSNKQNGKIYSEFSCASILCVKLFRGKSNGNCIRLQIY